MTKNTTQYGTNTRLAHLGHDPRSYHGFVNPPVVRASTVLFPDYETMRDGAQPYIYGTRGTPTTDALSNALNALENAAGTILVPSGLAAISIPFLAFVKAGDHVLVVDSIYAPSRRFCDHVLTRMGVEVEYFDPNIADAFTTLMRDNTSVVLLEAPASNSFEMCDVPLIARLAHGSKSDCVVMMDNTWATPLYFKPLEKGCDISIHALTKYPSGHSDVLMGSVSANERCWKQLEDTQLTLGTCAHGDEAYLVLRGLRSMNVRMAHQSKTTMDLCQWLQVHPKIARVLYPALPDDPGYELWKKDYSGASGLFSIVLDGCGEAEGARFLNALEIFGLGYSWAGHESLAVMPVFADRTIAKAPEGGVTIRLQIGLEDYTDLKADLEKALAAI